MAVVILKLKKNSPQFFISLWKPNCRLSLVYLFCKGVLKDYLRELPSPLITKQLYEAVLDAMAKNPLKMSSNGCKNDPSDSKYTVDLLDCLPDVEKVSTTGYLFPESQLMHFVLSSRATDNCLAILTFVALVSVSSLY